MGQGPGRWEKFRVVVARPSRMGRVGVRARHTFTRQGNKHPTRKQAPDEETSIRQGNRHSTRKQALNKETGTQQGNKHSTRKQALNKEASTQHGNRHSTRKQALNKETSTQQAKRHLFTDIFRYFLMLHMLDPYFPCRTSVFW